MQTKEELLGAITQMLEKIENPEYLFKIYHYILAKYRREYKEKETED